MNLAFILYAGAIPLVPLIGAEIFKRRQDWRHRDLCYACRLPFVYDDESPAP